MPNELKRLVPRDVEPDESKPGESKHDKFRRLANQRFRALKADMKRMGRLGGADYESTPQEIDKLISLLTHEFNFMVEQLKRSTNHGAADDIFGDNQ